MIFVTNPKKSLGQNFLVDKNIIKKIIEIGNVEKDQTVLEIGSGSGNLTQHIIDKKPKKIIAIEKDKKLSFFIKKLFINNKNFNLINNDVLEIIKNKSFGKNVIVFGNLPYNISTQILAYLILLKKWPPWYKILILMFQKEVADRIIAKGNTPSYGRLSILSNWKLDVKRIMNISPNSFFPKPKIKSSLLFFSPKHKFFKIKNPKNLEMITRIFFNQRRKMIKKPFSQIFKNSTHVAKKLNIDLTLRPQNLSPNAYYRITKEYENLGN